MYMLECLDSLSNHSLEITNLISECYFIHMVCVMYYNNDIFCRNLVLGMLYNRKASSIISYVKSYPQNYLNMSKNWTWPASFGLDVSFDFVSQLQNDMSMKPISSDEQCEALFSRLEKRVHDAKVSRFLSKYRETIKSRPLLFIYRILI